jgi:DNA polymerase-3 subunit delta'
MVMSWNKIVGHERTKRILQNSIIDNRISHAYCFTGIEGIGKDALAIQFAKVVNCIQPKVLENSIDSCETCHSCKAFESLSHPNVELVFSLPAGKSSDSKGDSIYDKMGQDQIDLIKEELLHKAENPYLPISLPNATQIKIANIREIKQKLSLSSFNGKRRFVIILNADEMNTEAANAFLKTLEEPHENITIIMITSKPESLLQTIMSRCQQIIIQPLDDKQIVRKLILDDNIDEIDAKIAARFSNGSYLKAREYVSSENKLLRNELVDILRTSLKKANFREDMVRKIEAYSKAKDKNQLSRSLQMLMFWLNDVYSLKNGAGENQIVNSDDIATLKKFAGAFGDKNIPASIEEIEYGVSLIYRNININLSLMNIFLKLRQNFIA